MSKKNVAILVDGEFFALTVASNDTDLIPAFKVARRHGVQVVIAQVGDHEPHRDLVEDSDFKRRHTPIL